jgi:hypothetical protein
VGEAAHLGQPALERAQLVLEFGDDVGHSGSFSVLPANG